MDGRTDQLQLNLWNIAKEVPRGKFIAASTYQKQKNKQTQEYIT